MHIYRKLSLTLKRIPKIPIKLNFILTCITNLPLENVLEQGMTKGNNMCNKQSRL